MDCATCIRGGALTPPRSALLTRVFKAVVPAQARRRLRRGLFPSRSLEAQPSALAIGAGDLQERQESFRRALLLAKRLLVPSEYVRRQYAINGYPAERIEVLPLGIDVACRPHAPEDGRLVLGSAGALIPAKGLHTLIQAFTRTPGDHLRLQLHGRTDADPAYMRGLQRLAGDDARIEFMGPFAPEQRSRVYASMDALALPSTAPETFSLAAREALACGTPVLAARIGALPEAVFDGVNGFLFEPGNTDELAALLAGISHDPGRLAKLTLPGPAIILSADEHARRVEAIYRTARQPSAD